MNSTAISNTLRSMEINTAQTQSEATKTTGSSDLDQNAFLQLLMAQMKYQDPMNPTDSSQFMSQQAQFTQIGELQKLNSNLSSSNQMMQSSALIGKEVALTDPDDSKKTITGIVDAAVMDSSGAGLVINGKTYPMENVLLITTPEAVANAAKTETENSDSTSTATN